MKGAPGGDPGPILGRTFWDRSLPGPGAQSGSLHPSRTRWPLMWSPEAPSHSVLHYSSDCLGYRRRQVVDMLQEHVLIDEVRCVGVVDTYKYPPDKVEVVNRRIGAETPKTSVGTDELRGAGVRAALVVQDAHAPDVGSAHAAGDDAMAIRQIVHTIGENAQASSSDVTTRSLTSRLWRGFV